MNDKRRKKTAKDLLVRILFKMNEKKNEMDKNLNRMK